MDDEEKKKWSAWLGIPFQMLAIIFGGYWLGSFLDNKYASEQPWWTIGLSLLAVLISLYQLIRQVQETGRKK